MNIAYTTSVGRGETDLLLHDFADALIKNGHIPAGTVQINSECNVPGRCDMDVRILPEGPVIRISQSLGKASKGCRLDASALETAVGLADTALDTEAECLIVNKFGKQEAAGSGFRPVIAKAMELGIPVIVGLGRQNWDAFQEFTGGMAHELQPNLKALKDWFLASREPETGFVKAKSGTSG